MSIRCYQPNRRNCEHEDYFNEECFCDKIRDGKISNKKLSLILSGTIPCPCFSFWKFKLKEIAAQTGLCLVEKDSK